MRGTSWRRRPIWVLTALAVATAGFGVDRASAHLGPHTDGLLSEIQGRLRLLLRLAIAATLVALVNTGTPALAADRVPPTLLFTSAFSVSTIRADGTGLRQLASGLNMSATWEPRGRRIAYTNNDCNVPLCLSNIAELRVMHADGSRNRRLFSLPRSAFFDVTWSPDGTWLAFMVYTGSSCWGCPPAWELHLIDAEGGSHRSLGPANGVAWAPNSRLVAIDTAAGIVVGDVTRQFVPTGVRGVLVGAYDPVWSPDGRYLAFSKSLPTEAAATLWVAKPDGSNARLIGRHATGSTPSWAPNSRAIATVRTGHTGIVTADLSSGRMRRLPAPKGTVTGVAWSPDGAWIAYTHFRYSDNESIRRIRPDGSGDRQLVGGQQYLFPALSWRAR